MRPRGAGAPSLSGRPEDDVKQLLESGARIDPASTKQGDVSPRHLDVSPRHFHVSPGYLDVSPRHFHVSPGYLDVSPRHFHVSPGYLDVSPRHFHVSPRYLDVSPRHVAPSPLDAVVAPEPADRFVERLAGVAGGERELAGGARAVAVPVDLAHLHRHPVDRRAAAELLGDGFEHRRAHPGPAVGHLEPRRGDLARAREAPEELREAPVRAPEEVAPARS